MRAPTVKTANDTINKIRLVDDLNSRAKGLLPCLVSVDHAMVCRIVVIEADEAKIRDVQSVCVRRVYQPIAYE